MSITVALANQGAQLEGSAGMNNMFPATWLTWFYSTTTTNPSNRPMISKAYSRLTPSGSGQITFVVERDEALNGGTATYVSDTGYVTLNNWHFVATTFNDANANGSKIHIYYGNLTSSASEVSYATSSDGNTTIPPQDDSLNKLFIMNNVFKASGHLGKIACFSMVKGELSLGQIRSWQFQPIPISGTLLYMNPGFNGTGNLVSHGQVKITGSLMNATAVSNHVPVASPFSF